MSILDKLTHLSATKDLIKAAIVAKGVSVSDEDTFRTYADKIAAIPSGGGGGVNGTIAKTATLGEAVETGDIVFVVRKNTLPPGVINNPIKDNDPYGSPLPIMKNSYYTPENTTGIAMSGDGKFIVGTGSGAAPVSLKWNESNNRYESTAAAVGGDWNWNQIGCSLSYDGSYLALVYDNSPWIITMKWVEGNNRYEATNAPDSRPSGNHSWCCKCQLSSDGSKLVVYSYVSPYLWAYKWSALNNRYEITTVPNLSPPSPGSGEDSFYYNGRMGFAGNAVLSRLHFGTDGNYFMAYNWNENNNRYEQGNLSSLRSSQWCRSNSMSGDGSVLIITHTEGSELLWYNEANSRYESKLTNSGAMPPIMTAKEGHYSGYGRPIAPAVISKDGSVIVAPCGTTEPFFMLYQFNGTSGLYEATMYPDVFPGYNTRAFAVSDDGSKIAVLRANHPGNSLYLMTYTNSQSANLAAYKSTNFSYRSMPLNCYAIGYALEDGAAGDSISIACLWIKENVFA